MAPKICLIAKFSQGLNALTDSVDKERHFNTVCLVAPWLHMFTHVGSCARMRTWPSLLPGRGEREKYMAQPAWSRMHFTRERWSTWSCSSGVHAVLRAAE